MPLLSENTKKTLNFRKGKGGTICPSMFMFEYSHLSYIKQPPIKTKTKKCIPRMGVGSIITLYSVTVPIPRREKLKNDLCILILPGRKRILVCHSRQKTGCSTI